MSGVVLWDTYEMEIDHSMFKNIFDVPKKIRTLIIVSFALMLWMLLALWQLGGMAFYSFLLVFIITMLFYFMIFCLYLKENADKKKILYSVLGINLGVMICGMVLSAIFTKKTDDTYAHLQAKQCMAQEELADEKNADLLAAIPQLTLTNGVDGVFLRWTGVADVDGYAVFRKDKAEEEYVCLAYILNPNTLSYTDISMLPNTEYTYAVCAMTKGKIGKCVPCDVKSGIKRPEVSLTNKGETVLLEWSWIQGVQDYHVYRKETNGGSYEEIACIPDGEVLLFEDTPPAFGVKYTYAIRGHIGDLKGSVRTANVILTMEESVVNAACTDEGVKVSWTPVDYAEKYQVFRRLSGEKWESVASVSTNELEWLDSDAMSNTSYDYAVRAKRGRYSSPYTQVTITTGTFANRDQELQNEKDKEIAESLERITLTLAAGGSDDKATVKLSWNKASVGNGYHIYRKLEGEDEYTLINTITDLGTTSFTDENVESGKAYLYYVCGFAGAYDGKYSGSKIELK